LLLVSREPVSDLAFELHQLDLLVEKLELALADAVPGELYASHLGHILHGLYNGFEKCLVFVLRSRSEEPIEGPNWHSQLALRFRTELGEHAALASELRGFRHVFRNAYGYELEFDRVRTLAEKTPSFWMATREWLWCIARSEL
jgi:hypothetical protein